MSVDIPEDVLNRLRAANIKVAELGYDFAVLKNRIQTALGNGTDERVWPPNVLWLDAACNAIVNYRLMLETSSVSPDPGSITVSYQSTEDINTAEVIKINLNTD